MNIPRHNRKPTQEEMLPADPEAQLQRLEQEVAHVRQIEKKWLKRFGWGTLLALIAIGWKFWAIGKSADLEWTMTLLTGCAMMSLHTISFLLIRERTIRQKRNQALIERLRAERRAVGLLVAYHGKCVAEGELFRLLNDVLISLLPHLQANDVATFSEEQMNALLRLLGNQNRDLVMAALKALEQVGDQRAVEPLKKLHVRKKDTAIREAAENCLAYVQERVAIQTQTTTLLRSASSTEASQETLLRPASGHAHKEWQEQLLRPLE